MEETYFLNSSHILWIRVVKSYPTADYSFGEAIPARKKIIGGVEDEVPEGWFDRYGDRTDLERIKERRDYIFNPSTNSFATAPKIEIESISGKYSKTTTKYFLKDEDAYEYARELAKSFPSLEVQI
jgi:hypothetical protein